jgi:hypothetical protein
MRALLPVVVVLLLAAGCGGPTAAERVQTTWAHAAEAISDGAGARFCELASATGRQTITARTSLSCEDSVRLLAGQLTTADTLAIRAARITRVEVDGDTAVVSYVLATDLARFGFTGETLLVREGGKWRLQGI